MAGKVAIDKVKLDIATNEKLRRAYYDAERGLTEKDKNEFAEIAKYLREVRDTPVCGAGQRTLHAPYLGRCREPARKARKRGII